ncbi:MAG TPA: GGDEF domain-containing protein [Burkholderiaceae bacterium]|nr:GGDEF domain-containing protein [Burkholderiaceae bacterium]
MTISSLHDTLSSRRHSRDFAFSRGDFLRNRVMVVGAIFLVLLPFWSLIDWFVLPEETRAVALTARVVMLAILAITVLVAQRSKARLQLSRLAAGTLLSTPAVFYAIIMSTLTGDGGAASLVGYSFIPYMLVAMLAIFPFTLLESAALGLAIILLEAWALYATGALFTLAGLQAVWLLAALLVISITANYFQLALMLRLYREATHDPLTGLLNRGALLQAMEQFALNDPDARRALLIMDLDHFKRINDTHGHAFGDDILRHFAGVLRRSLRPADLTCRYGGEEFVAVLMDTDKDAALAIAENIRAQTEVSVLNDYDGEPVRYTVSIGVASFYPDETFLQATMRADNRLYEAKKTSRNRVVGV